MQAYRRYFGAVFLNRAQADSGLSSWVYERRGQILGFIGVMARRMRFEGRPVLAAVCTQFVVDPGERGQAGLQMLKHCFNGPQDLSISDEANDETRKIWEWCGGSTAIPYSIHWLRPLRPVQTALSLAGTRQPVVLLARASAVVARVVEAAIGGPRGPLRLAAPCGSREELDEATLLACVRQFSSDRAIAPDYDAAALTWVIERARHNSTQLRKFLIRDEAHRVIGWFVYSGHRHGIAEVLQVAAAPRAARHVLNHLLDDAWRRGAVALSGRLEPAFAPELSEHGCLLYRRGYWTLVQSKRAELSHALQRGDAFFSRLEGEWCLRFS
jgi:hypothetical protein